MTKLSVNINKIATLRNARGGNNPNVLAVARDAEPVVARETTPRAGAVVPATRFVVRATVDASTPRFTIRPLARLVELERAVAFDVCIGTTAGAIGSANTARIDKNVEHTKNAPAKRNTVPMAFFATVAILRLFIHYSPADANPTNPPFQCIPNGTLLL